MTKVMYSIVYRAALLLGYINLGIVRVGIENKSWVKPRIYI